MNWLGINWIVHITKEHIKGKKILAKCWLCWFYYLSLCLVFALIPWKINNNHMSEVWQWVLIVIAISIPAIIVALINYFAYKKKIAAETENIKLKNKITKEITYDQLKTDNKHKNIKSKIGILADLNKLEAEIRSKENLTTSDHKKLESLEAIKREFKQTFVKDSVNEKPQLAESQKSLEAKEEKTTKNNSERKVKK